MNGDDERTLQELLDLGDSVLAKSNSLLDEATTTSEQHGRWTSRNEWPVSVQAASANRKLAPQRRVQVGDRIRNEPVPPYCSSTHVSIEATCPGSCVFKNSGCYAQAGMVVQRLDRGAKVMNLSGVEVIEMEAMAIDGMFARGVPQDGARGGRDLRLHVSGDVSSAVSARMLAAAAKRWQARGGGEVWTYTHRWREIPHEDWGPIRALASVETMRNARVAQIHGYAAALTVSDLDGDQARLVQGLRIVPCLAQTRGKTCATCRLCFAPNLAERGVVVEFAVHGKDEQQARRKLRALS